MSQEVVREYFHKSLLDARLVSTANAKISSSDKLTERYWSSVPRVNISAYFPWRVFCRDCGEVTAYCRNLESALETKSCPKCKSPYVEVRGP